MCLVAAAFQAKRRMRGDLEVYESEVHRYIL